MKLCDSYGIGRIVQAPGFECRPVAVAHRTAVVLSTAAAVGAGLLYDRLTGGLVRNAPLRAAQARELSWSNTIFCYLPVTHYTLSCHRDAAE